MKVAFECTPRRAYLGFGCRWRLDEQGQGAYGFWFGWSWRYAKWVRMWAPGLIVDTDVSLFRAPADKARPRIRVSRPPHRMAPEYGVIGQL